MLNPSLRSTSDLYVPFANTDPPQALRLLIDESTAGESVEVRALAALTARPSVRAYSTGTSIPGRLTFGRPVVERDYLPAELEDSRESGVDPV